MKDIWQAPNPQVEQLKFEWTDGCTTYLTCAYRQMYRKPRYPELCTSIYWSARAWHCIFHSL